MPEFLCPHCRGGFDRPRYHDDDEFCPWCGTQLDLSYDPNQFERVVSHVKQDDNDEFTKSILGDLFR